MGKVQYDVCDRCGERINYNWFKRATIRMPKTKWIICGSVVEKEWLLCTKCSGELDNFLYPKKKD